MIRSQPDASARAAADAARVSRARRPACDAPGSRGPALADASGYERGGACVCAVLLAAVLGCDAGPPAPPPAPTAAALLERGKLLRERGETAAAAETLTAGLELPAEDDVRAELFLERGVARERAGDDEAAEADYTAAVEADPALARAWNNRAAVRARGGRLDEALADWDRCLELDPDSVQALLNRALARQERGDVRGALADAAAAGRLAPDAFGPPYRTGAALLAGGDPAAALPPLDDAARLAADDAAAALAHRDRAAALRALGRIGESADAWAEAVRRDPGLRTTPEGFAAAALADAVAALAAGGLAPTGEPPPAGFDLAVRAKADEPGGDVRPVLIAEPAGGGACVLGGDDLRLLEATPAALVVVPGDPPRALTAADVFARGPRPVRFLIPPAADAPAPVPAGG